MPGVRVEPPTLRSLERSDPAPPRHLALTPFAAPSPPPLPAPRPCACPLPTDCSRCHLVARAAALPVWPLVAAPMAQTGRSSPKRKEVLTALERTAHKRVCVRLWRLESCTTLALAVGQEALFPAPQPCLALLRYSEVTNGGGHREQASAFYNPYGFCIQRFVY